MSGEKFLEELAKEIQREENLDIYSHVQLDESSFRHIADFVLSKVMERIEAMPVDTRNIPDVDEKGRCFD